MNLNQQCRCKIPAYSLMHRPGSFACFRAILEGHPWPGARFLQCWSISCLFLGARTGLSWQCGNPSPSLLCHRVNNSSQHHHNGVFLLSALFKGGIGF